MIRILILTISETIFPGFRFHNFDGYVRGKLSANCRTIRQSNKIIIAEETVWKGEDGNKQN